MASIVGPQVHAGIERGDLGVAVEHESLTLEDFAQTPLLCLAPARMIDGWIDVRIKAVFTRSRFVPTGERLPFREFHSYDGPDALLFIFSKARGAAAVG